jgi:hypothetical protein
VSHAAIGPGATIEATNVIVTADMDHDSEADADGLAMGAFGVDVGWRAPETTRRAGTSPRSAATHR